VESATIDSPALCGDLAFGVVDLALAGRPFDIDGQPLPEIVLMTRDARVPQVPAAMRSVYESVVSLTDDVCNRSLDAEYRDLARAMAAALCRKRPSPLSTGQPRTWACGILYVLGKVNFLSAPSANPHLPTKDLRKAS
jgi:hypothetical protein